MKNRTFKNIIAVIVMLSIFLPYEIFLSDDINYVEFAWYLVILLLTLLFFNFIIRRVVWFKPYFISKYNFFSTKAKVQKEFDIPKEILFDKFLEVLTTTGFKIKNTNKVKGEIFAITSMSWKSYGENIYLTLKDSKKGTTVDFYSVCVMQIYDWGKNEINLNKVLQEFDNSLTI
jgi:hypothetical protein